MFPFTQQLRVGCAARRVIADGGKYFWQRFLFPCGKVLFILAIKLAKWHVIFGDFREHAARTQISVVHWWLLILMAYKIRTLMKCVISSGGICLDKFRSREILPLAYYNANGKISPFRSFLASVEMTQMDIIQRR
jgi:hypothetical protein